MTTSSYANVIPDEKQRDDTPDWRDLHSNVVSQYAVHWEAIGAELGLEHYHIANISKDHHNRTEDGCAAMLMKWLKSGTSPTWGKLDDAIIKIVRKKEPSIACGVHVVDNSKPAGVAVSYELSSNIKEQYVVTRFSIENDSWPPEQPKEYTTLAFIHRKNQPTQQQIFTLAKQKATGKVDSVVDATRGSAEQFSSDEQDSEALAECLKENKSTRNIADILAPLENSDEKKPRTVLIEGAPGLGKTVLLKQIAFEWAQGKQLVKSQFVFLLFLRDPTVREMSSVTDLVKYFSTKSTETCKTHADTISETNGKNITFLLDGYDELPSKKKEDSFIAKIIQHKILPLSAVVVSSRPHASTLLRNNALCQVDILGFAKDDQLVFFQTALNDQPGKLQHLLSYLEDHSIISSLCYVPFIMTVLLWFFKQEIPLPKNSTGLYTYFICHTIHRHLAKDAVSSNVITDLDSLSQPYKMIIQQLSVLCLKALENSDLVFSLQDIKDACPDIDTFPGAINGFGLLQAVEHYSQDPKLMGATTKTLNFIHSSIQEYLAAYQITCLPPKKEMQFIQNNFFSEFYTNTFTFYVGMTKGQRPCFKKFLSCYGKNFVSSFFTNNTNKITSRFLKDDRRSLRLFQYFYEADDQNSCENVTENMHRTKYIYLIGLTPLLPSDLNCLTLFLSTSPGILWNKLELSRCHIGDAGLRMLHQSLVTSGIKINYINLDDNSLTSQSSDVITEMIAFYKINVAYNKLTDGLNLSKISTDKQLDISYNQMTSSGACKLFATARHNKNCKLQEIDVSNNSIGDEAVNDIAHFLMENDVLQTLNISFNEFSAKGMLKILMSLHSNETLRWLGIGLGFAKYRQIFTEMQKLRKKKNNSKDNTSNRFHIHVT